MIIKKTNLQGCLVIEPDIFTDKRGFFMEAFNSSKYYKAGIKNAFVQDNQSKSLKGVLRGLHYQKNNPQGKLVRVSLGEVFDVALDIRPESETFGKWHGEYLSDSNKKQLWIPPGFAHGFLVTSDEAIFDYKCTEYYFPEDQNSILWCDPFIKIDWPSKQPILSIKDSSAKTLKEALNESLDNR